MKFIARHDAFRNDDFWFEVDEYKNESGEQVLLVHLRVHHWSPSVLKELFRVWKAFRQHVKVPCLAVPEADEEKWHKLVQAFGFKPLADRVPCENGELRPLYIHTV